jgi:hypothetical protein
MCHPSPLTVERSGSFALHNTETSIVDRSGNFSSPAASCAPDCRTTPIPSFLVNESACGLAVPSCRQPRGRPIVFDLCCRVSGAVGSEKPPLGRTSPDEDLGGGGLSGRSDHGQIQDVASVLAYSDQISNCRSPTSRRLLSRPTLAARYRIIWQRPESAGFPASLIFSITFLE